MLEAICTGDGDRQRCFRLLISIAGSIAACPHIACADVRIPGAIIAASNVPSGSHQIIRRSGTIVDYNNRTAVNGVSRNRIHNPVGTNLTWIFHINTDSVLNSADTNRLHVKIFDNCNFKECIISGTTDAIITASTPELSIP